MTFIAQTFTHHGRAFTIEADNWPGEEEAWAAILDLQIWAMALSPAASAMLHDALALEREALMQETEYDRNQSPLPALPDAQRNAVKTGLAGRGFEGEMPIVTLEAFQVSDT